LTAAREALSLKLPTRGFKHTTLDSRCWQTLVWLLSLTFDRGYALANDQEKSRLQANAFAAEALQDSRQTDSAKLLARRPSEYGLRGMLSNHRSSAARETALQNSRAPDPAQSVVVGISQ
jgi:hypothetical protein